MNSRKTGELGEEIAAKYLKNKGYQILERNFQRKVSRFLKSEIDIIAKKDDTICFVEVKALNGGQGFLPEEKVDFQKKRKLIRTAESWLEKNLIPFEGTKWQIDVISIEINSQLKKTKISHFENAVSDFTL